MLESVLPMFSSRSFIVSGLTFRSEAKILNVTWVASYPLAHLRPQTQM